MGREPQNSGTATRCDERFVGLNIAKSVNWEVTDATIGFQKSAAF